MGFRIESDFLGSRDIPAEALYGIHSVRARENFPDKSLFSEEWYKALGIVKLACYLTYQKYAAAIRNRYKDSNVPVKLIPDDIINVLATSARELSDGFGYDFFIVPAVSGGAGTSINMNVNEILTNTALIKTGRKPGDYSAIDPIEMANVFQSTNDVVPTALKIAVMRMLKDLETAVNSARLSMEKLETAAHHDLRIAYTQLQEAVPSSFGKLFSTYSEALSRDWWRISKCFERIKLVNLGGGAIGTGIGSPRYFIMEVVQELQQLTCLPIARSENMPDATANLDSFVEVHAILKSHAVNLEKISSDIRLLGSDFGSSPQLSLPQKQLGSTIMPGKVNPVIPEFVISVAHKVYANDNLITSLCGQGMLELNAYLPVIGDALLNSLELLIAANNSLKDNLLEGLQWNKEVSGEKLLRSPAITTALSPYIGYNKASEMAKMMKSDNIDIFECNAKKGYLPEEQLADILKPENLLKMGYTLTDIASENH
ncbi:MAG: lyase family protein [Bacteroidales bacterium]